MLRDQYNNVNSTAPVTWTSTAGEITGGGVLSAQTQAQMGRSVTATSGAASGSAVVDVYPAATSSIVVSPGSTQVLFNRTQQFTATAYDQHGNANASVVIAWSATSGSISGGGLYTAPAVGGTVTVTASGDGKSGTATVLVRREVHVSAMATFKSGVAATSFKKGTDTVEVRTTVRDHDNNLVAGGASVVVEFLDDRGDVQSTSNTTTDASGVASATYPLPQNARTGQWTARVTVVSGTHLVYNSAANVVSSVNFQVTAN
ncbi:MAG TPA: MG2 domain-containing protein [Candidatus Thermoplasmatota archaeon]|nr:MG2 domain-containing protein [Candidatus Thermoplasmatota archaeon]